MMNTSLYRVGHDIASKFIELLGDNKTLAVIDQVKLQRNDYAPHNMRGSVLLVFCVFLKYCLLQCPIRWQRQMQRQRKPRGKQKKRSGVTLGLGTLVF